MTTQPSPDLAERFARIALGHVAREYPNKLALLLNGPGDLATPRQLYPLFWGSFDWHSCVHAHWLLAAVLRFAPELPVGEEIRHHFAGRFSPEAVEAERANFDRPHNGGFERPYGWAWLLALHGELLRNPQLQHSAAVLVPLAQRIAAAFMDFLPRATYPVRGGAHFNTAFALVLALDYAAQVGDVELQALCARRARDWYGHDRAAQAWEPSGDDFLSPTLIEAEAMRRALEPKDFLRWLEGFLPSLADGEPATLFTPATVSDRSDGKIAHLDGLNLSRAWCWRGLATALPAGDARRARMLDSARSHLESALPQLTGDYMGEHWLASFAWLALSLGDDAP